ncbi:MAG: PorT family protein [Bacteroidales bacterium]|nr:PorT family protein [Bacteroidales bacterium]
MKDWLNDIHDKLGDFETKAPEGLWAKIAAGQPASAGKAGSSVHDDQADKVTPLYFWGRRIAAAGAAAAAVFAGVLLFRNYHSTGQPEMIADAQGPSSQQENVIRDIPSDDVPSAADEVLTDSEEVIMDRTESRTPRLVTTPADEGFTAPIDDDGHDAGAVDSKLINDKTIAEGRTVDAGSEVRSRQEDGLDDAQTAGDGSVDLGSGRERRNGAAKRVRDGMGRSRGAVSIGIINSYGTQSASTLAFAGPAMAVAGPSNDAVWDDGPMLGMTLFDARVGEAKYTHRMPVRVGVTLDWQLAERWFIESGLTYTRLNSSIRHGDDENYTGATQKLDYIGIPLNLKFKAFGTPRFGLYASAGMNMDKCVAASRSASYRFSTAGGTESGSLGTEKYDERPFQLSANLAMGAAYLISPLISIYVEPGMSWYFDDRSSLDTIYKERPLNFSMNLGLRFTLTRGR